LHVYGLSGDPQYIKFHPRQDKFYALQELCHETFNYLAYVTQHL